MALNRLSHVSEFRLHGGFNLLGVLAHGLRGVAFQTRCAAARYFNFENSHQQIPRLISTAPRPEITDFAPASFGHHGFGPYDYLALLLAACAFDPALLAPGGFGRQQVWPHYALVIDH